MMDKQPASDSDDHNGNGSGIKQDSKHLDDELVVTKTASLGTLEAAVMNSTGISVLAGTASLRLRRMCGRWTTRPTTASAPESDVRQKTGSRQHATGNVLGATQQATTDKVHKHTGTSRARAAKRSAYSVEQTTMQRTVGSMRPCHACVTRIRSSSAAPSPTAPPPLTGERRPKLGSQSMGAERPN